MILIQCQFRCKSRNATVSDDPNKKHTNNETIKLESKFVGHKLVKP